MAEFKNVLLSEIRPDPNNPRQIFDTASMQELTDSIREKGVLQPIMVRPFGNDAKGYMLVCGERRLRASIAVHTLFKERDMIPAMIRQLSDEEAFEVQIIENLQRKDVHPMEEAIAYKTYQEKKKVTIDELSAKFAKSKEYIAQRLSFNSLIKEFQTDFYSGQLLIGHAVMLARITAADQKDLLPQIRRHHHKDGISYDTIDEVREQIENEIMHELGAASFDKKDEKLIAKAGSCLACPKRSGSGLLFADVKEKDRCFDAKCYEAKKKAHLVRSVEDIVINNPGMPIITERYGGNMDKDVNKLIQGHKLKPLQEYDEYRNVSASTPGAVKALAVSGHRAGQTVYVKLESAKKNAPAIKKSGDATAKLTADDIDIEIQRIQTREKRSKELDGEKVWAEIKTLIDKNGKALYVDLPLNKEESTSLAVAMMNKIGPRYGEIEKKVGLNTKIKSITDKELFKLFRLFILDILVSSYGSHLKEQSDNWRAYQLIKGYLSGEVKVIEKKFQADVDKRVERVNKRIADLRTQKKGLTEKKTAAVKKPANNKGNTPPPQIKSQIRSKIQLKYLKTINDV